MHGAIEGRMLSPVTSQAHVIRLRGRDLRRVDDLRLCASTLKVLFFRTVTACTQHAFAAARRKRLRMRVLRIALDNCRMASRAGTRFCPGGRDTGAAPSAVGPGCIGLSHCCGSGQDTYGKKR